jgi:N2227-like protein.
MVYEIVWTSDIVLACLFPLAFLYLGFRLSLSLTWKELRELLSLTSKPTKNDQFSLNRAHQSYAGYSQLSAHELSRMQASYSTLGRTHKRLGYNIGYTTKLNRLKEVTALNSEITKGISDLARMEFGLDRGGVAEVGGGNLERVRESLKHFVRDGSEQGFEEREKIFAPILDVLRRVDAAERATNKVLVPGSGLGRLAWEISELGACLTTGLHLYTV